ncbi:hypothetical protein YC2023_025266 [Brassica napus]
MKNARDGSSVVMSRPIIHRDVKTCNIMLDAKFNTKLSDFWVYEHSAMLAGRKATLPPEYVYTGYPSDKIDVTASL